MNEKLVSSSSSLSRNQVGFLMSIVGIYWCKNHMKNLPFF